MVKEELFISLNNFLVEFMDKERHLFSQEQYSNSDQVISVNAGVKTHQWPE